MRRASLGLLMKPPSIKMAGFLMLERTLNLARLIPLSGTLYFWTLSFMRPWMAVASAMLAESWWLPLRCLKSELLIPRP